MPAPSVAINRFDLSMGYSEFSLMASRMGFIGLRCLPGIGVAKDSGSFAKILVEALLTQVEDTERKARTTYKRDDYEWTTDSYDCADHGVEEVVDDLTIERYGDIIRAEAVSQQRAIHRVLQALENDIASAVFNTSTWTGGTLTTAVGTPWTTKATCDPVSDIEGAIEKVIQSSGMRPNTIIMSDFAFRHMRRSTRMEDLIPTTGPQELKNATLAQLAEFFMVDQILVGNSFKNTADEGQSASFSRFWDQTMCMVAHVSDDGMQGDLEAATPAIGRTVFSTTGGQSVPGLGDGEDALIVEEYREESRRGGIIRARNKRHVKILHPEAGHLLTAVTA